MYKGQGLDTHKIQVKIQIRIQMQMQDNRDTDTGRQNLIVRMLRWDNLS